LKFAKGTPVISQIEVFPKSASPYPTWLKAIDVNNRTITFSWGDQTLPLAPDAKFFFLDHRVFVWVTFRL